MSLLASITVRDQRHLERPAPKPHASNGMRPCGACAFHADPEACRLATLASVAAHGRGQHCVTRHVVYLNPGEYFTTMNHAIIPRDRVIAAYQRALALDPDTELAIAAVAASLCLPAEAVADAVADLQQLQEQPA